MPESLAARPSTPAGEDADNHADARELQREVARLNAMLSDLQAALLETEARLREQTAMNDGTEIKLARRLHAMAKRMAPQGTLRHRTLRRSLRLAAATQDAGLRGLKRELGKDRRIARLRGRPVPGSLDDQYQRWLALHVPGTKALEEMRTAWLTWQQRPLISVVLGVHADTPELRATIASVQAQAYGNWEICDALTAAGGEFVLLLEPGSALQPHALFALVSFLQKHPDADVIYADEDRITQSGRRGDPQFKPDWSPDLLLSCNYLGEPVLVRRELVSRAGGLRPELDEGGHHDLYLRVTELAREVGHVDDVLETRPDGVPAARDRAETGQAAIADALHRRDRAGRVEQGEAPGHFHVRYQIQGNPSVGIIIPTRDRVEALRACIESIETKSSWRNVTITIVDNDSKNPETLQYLDGFRHRVIQYPGAFNYSRIINTAARQVDAEHLLFLNNDMVVITPDWIEAMLEHSQRPEVGVVGARLLFPTGIPQHEGIALMRPGPGNLNMGLPLIRDVVAVTGACTMVRHTVFDEVHGMDETLVVAFGDVDFCMRVHARGYWIVYTPHAQLYHEESTSRGLLNPAHDAQIFCARWGAMGEQHDPFLSRHILYPNPLGLRLE